MKDNALKIIRAILFYDKKIWPVAGTFFLLLLARITLLGALYVFQLIIDHINIAYLKQNTPSLTIALPITFLLIYFILRFFSELSSTLSTIFFGSLSQNTVEKQALRLFKHLQCLSSHFYTQSKTGEIIGTLEKGIRGIEFIYQSVMVYLLPNLLELVFISAYFLFLFEIKITLALLLCLIIYGMLNFYSIKKQLFYRLKLNDAYLSANHISFESIFHHELVKCFNLEELKSHEYKDAIHHYKQHHIKSNNIASLFNFAKNSITSLFSFVMIIWSGNQVLQHQMTIGQFLLINTLLYQIFHPLSMISNFYGQIRQSLLDTHLMLKMMDYKIDIIDSKNNIAIDHIKHNITFHNLSFGYHPEKTILNHISLIIPQGKITAIVGESGSGKSTLSCLLLRLYNITSGKITLDDHNIQDIPLTSLRNIISIVPQEVSLFNQSILYNLTLGRHDISMKKIIKACKQSGIYFFIKHLPEKFNTSVGERGLCLSGGEKQRIGIARALLKESPVLILDEATSALDVHHEQHILHTILSDTTKKTILIISHRLQSIQRADNIIVLHNGCLVEQGIHDDLIKNKQNYYRLWIGQKK